MTGAPITRQRLAGLSPDAAAALWQVALQGDGIVAEAGLFDEWLEASELNRAAWAHQESLWYAFDDLDKDRLDTLRAEALAATPEPARTPWAKSAAAAALVLLGAGTLYGVYGDGPGTPDTEVATAAEPVIYATRAGATETVRLADGSAVTMSGDTRLRVAFADRRRDLQLDRGRAFFDVAHDRTRPFEVVAAGRTVTALGTQFDVTLAGKRLRVALVRGSVRVTARDRKPVLLRPGEQLEATAQGADRVSRFDKAALVATAAPMAVFADTPLGEVIKTVNGYGGKQLIIRDPKVAALRLNGQFRMGDPERFARTVAQILPVRLVPVKPDGIELRAKR